MFVHNITLLTIGCQSHFYSWLIMQLKTWLFSRTLELLERAIIQEWKVAHRIGLISYVLFVNQTCETNNKKTEVL